EGASGWVSTVAWVGLALFVGILVVYGVRHGGLYPADDDELYRVDDEEPKNGAQQVVAMEPGQQPDLTLKELRGLLRSAATASGPSRSARSFWSPLATRPCRCRAHSTRRRWRTCASSGTLAA